MIPETGEAIDVMSGCVLGDESKCERVVLVPTRFDTLVVLDIVVSINELFSESETE